MALLLFPNIRNASACEKFQSLGVLDRDTRRVHPPQPEPALGPGPGQRLPEAVKSFALGLIVGVLPVGVNTAESALLTPV